MFAEDVQRVSDAIPNDSAAAVFLIDYLRAECLKEALRDPSAYLIAEGIVTPEAFVMAGAAIEEAVEAAEEEKRPMAAPARSPAGRSASRLRHRRQQGRAQEPAPHLPEHGAHQRRRRPRPGGDAGGLPRPPPRAGVPVHPARGGAGRSCGGRTGQPRSWHPASSSSRRSDRS